VVAVVTGADKLGAAGAGTRLQSASIASADNPLVAATAGVLAVVSLANDKLVPISAGAGLRAASTIAADNLEVGADGAVELGGAVVAFADDDQVGRDSDGSVHNGLGGNIAVGVSESSDGRLGDDIAGDGLSDSSGLSSLTREDSTGLSASSSASASASSGSFTVISNSDVDGEQEVERNVLATSEAGTREVATTRLIVVTRARDITLSIILLGSGISVETVATPALSVVESEEAAALTLRGTAVGIVVL
jgi:hypothetical protein